MSTVAVLSGLLLCVTPVRALSQLETQQLPAFDIDDTDSFGVSVSISEDVAFVGALGDRCAAGLGCGVVYVFRFNGTNWVEEQKLTTADTYSRAFGTSVSVKADVAIVGAFADNCPAGAGCGSAYIFRFNGTSWVEEQKLTASDAGDSDSFGESVSISGATAIVGAMQNDCNATVNCGAAYVYRFNGTSWAEEQKLTASDAAGLDNFGGSVSIDGSTAVVGANGDDCAAGDFCGSAYMFRFNGTNWIEEKKLTASDAVASAHFGGSVSISNGAIIVGASLENCVSGPICGAAYVYRFDGSDWVEEFKFTASDAVPDQHFGSSVSISGGTIIVGASGDVCAAGANCGSAIVYQFNGTSWVEKWKLAASDGVPDHLFGECVAFSGDKAVVAARRSRCADLVGVNCRTAYVYHLAPAIPALTEWGLIIMLLLLFTGGTILINHRRAIGGTA